MSEEERLKVLVEAMQRKEWLAGKKQRIENGEMQDMTLPLDEYGHLDLQPIIRQRRAQRKRRDVKEGLDSNADGGASLVTRRKNAEFRDQEVQVDEAQMPQTSVIPATLTQESPVAPDSPLSPRDSTPEQQSALQESTQLHSSPESPHSSIIRQCWEEVEYENLMKANQESRLDASLNDVRIDASIFKKCHSRKPDISIKIFNTLYHEATSKVFYFMDLALSVDEINVLLEKQENLSRAEVKALWHSIKDTPQYATYKRKKLLRKYYVHRAELWGARVANPKSSPNGGITPRRSPKVKTPRGEHSTPQHGKSKVTR